MSAYRTIRVDGTIIAHLDQNGRFGESYNDVVRRLIGLPSVSPAPTALPGALQPLIAAGKLTTGQPVIWHRPRLGETHTATVSESGCLVTANGAEHPTPDMCASAIAGHPCKGWPHWRTADGTSLQELRDSLANPDQTPAQ